MQTYYPLKLIVIEVVGLQTKSYWFNIIELSGESTGDRIFRMKSNNSLGCMYVQMLDL